MCSMMLAVPCPWPGSCWKGGVHHTGRWSGPTRQLLPTFMPQVQGSERPHSQMLKKIGRPVLFNAWLMLV